MAAVTSFRTRDRVGVDGYLAFRARLRETLALGDLQAFREFLCHEGHARGDYDLVLFGRQSEHELTVLMHRLILADVALSGHHRASRTWLRQRRLEVPPASRGYGRPNAGRRDLAHSA